MQIRIFAVEIGPEIIETEGMKLVPEARRIRLAGIRNDARRKATLSGYALLRYAMKQTFGHSRLPKIEYGQFGKPYFPNESDMQFSISHTEGIVLCAVGDAPLGIDVERIRPVRAATIRKILGEEAGRFVSKDEELRCFFECWVLREAAGKRTGAGVTVGSLKGDCESGKGFSRLYSEIPGCCAAVCSDSPELPERIEMVCPEALWCLQSTEDGE